MKRFNSTVIGNCLFLPILAVSIIFFQLPAIANTEKIAILPFEIHSQTDLEYMGKGIYQMLESRLSWKDHVLVAQAGKLASNTDNSMKKTATALGADYVLSGSITEFSGAFSLDTTVFKTSTNSIETFFGQAGSIEEIIPQLDILAAKINNRLFDRKTAALESIKPAIPDGETINIRSNPEKLMPKNIESEYEEDRPFWKFWKSDNHKPKGKTDRPFWKFWKKDAPDPGDDEFESNETLETGTIQDSMDDPEKEKEDKPFWKFW